MSAPAGAERRELLALILHHSFERRRVVLASGRESDFYLDLRTTMMRPRGIELAGRLLFERLAAGPRVEAVGGMVVAAVPVVSAVLLAAATRGGAAWAELAGFFVRKEAKQHGLGKRIEGGFRAGQSVALVEDTMTTGGSTLEALDAVTAAGGRVARVLCIVDRGEGAADAFAQRGLALEALYTRADLPL
ncbi:MAG: orotate phosphoribosyltransferase [Deltaproteobacteria bacterium]|nr:orotate phosphoribosyltransferase [Deltaproteobacteria bacterium]